jgi:RES domain-containing protein
LTQCVKQNDQSHTERFARVIATAEYVWDNRQDMTASRSYSDAWLNERRTAIVLVPSAVARYDCNVLINPKHSDLGAIKASELERVIWDQFSHIKSLPSSSPLGAAPPLYFKDSLDPA